jgi:hypothetical protein
MKDYVLGSDEFLVHFYVLLERRLATCVPHSNAGEPATDNHTGGSQSPHHTPRESDSTTEDTPAADVEHELEPPGDD